MFTQKPGIFPAELFALQKIPTEFSVNKEKGGCKL
jgi:hypothetical protein